MINDGITAHKWGARRKKEETFRMGSDYVTGGGNAFRNKRKGNVEVNKW